MSSSTLAVRRPRWWALRPAPVEWRRSSFSVLTVLAVAFTYRLTLHSLPLAVGAVLAVSTAAALHVRLAVGPVTGAIQTVACATALVLLGAPLGWVAAVVPTLALTSCAAAPTHVAPALSLALPVSGWVSARIVGVDLAPAMLAVARTVDPTIDWREGNAVSLPATADEHFTVLTCHQGLQFLLDKPAALRAMRRVLAPGGRIAIAAWRSREDHPGVRDLNAIAERHVGQIADSRHSLGDASRLKSPLAERGFDHVDVQTVTHDVQFADGALFARLNGWP